MPRRTSLGIVVLTVLTTVPAFVPAPAGAALPPVTLPTWDRFYGDDTRHTAATVADVDGDGRKDIVFGALSGRLRVLDADGNPLPGWPRTTRVLRVASPIESTPTVADLDRDGDAEIVVGVGSVSVPRTHGALIVYDHRGNTLWRYVPRDIYTEEGDIPRPDGYAEGMYGTPAVGNVDNDRRLEIVIGGWDHRVHAFNHDGSHVRGFPVDSGDTISSSPALFDVDDDGRMEIFVGGDGSRGGLESTPGGVFRALDWEAGRVHQRWKLRSSENYWSSPAIGDIDRDGRMEMVVGGGHYYKTDDSRRVFAYNLEDGSRVPGWPRRVPWPDDERPPWTLASPALGDVTGDGRLDVVIVSKDGFAHAYHADGTKIWTVDPEPGGMSGLEASPTIADTDGDGTNEVVVPGARTVLLLDGETGAVRARLGAAGEQWVNLGSATVAPFGSRGWRVVTYGFQRDNGSRLAVYDIPRPGRTPPWPQFRRDQRHTGAFPGRDAAPWRRPDVRLVYRGGGVRGLGGAPFFGSAASRRHAGIVHGEQGSDLWGYGLFDRRGSVFAFGRFQHQGGAATGDDPVVAAVAHPFGNGYWLVTRGGSVLTRGTISFYGSAARFRHAGIVDAMVSPSGHGYALVDRAGGVFTFGDFRYKGFATDPRGRVVAAMAKPDGRGYALVTRRGAVHAYGKARSQDRGGVSLRRHDGIVDALWDERDRGYWLVDREGRVFGKGRVPAWPRRHPAPSPVAAAF